MVRVATKITEDIADDNEKKLATKRNHCWKDVYIFDGKLRTGMILIKVVDWKNYLTNL